MRKSVVVVGSVAWDEVVDIDAPLRPGTHNQGHFRGRRLGGGAANTALALQRGGNHVRVCSAVGSDADGEALLAILVREGLDTGGIARVASTTTRSMVFLEARGERTIVNLSRAPLVLPERLSDENTACVYVRSSDNALAEHLRVCAEKTLVIAHVPPASKGSRPAHILVGSRDDLESDFLADPWHAARQVAGPVLRWMVMTQGVAGAIAFSEDRVLKMPAPRREVVDTTGAGDVFAAGLIHALVRDQPMEQALRSAVSWGAASVTYEGTIPPNDFPPV